MWMEGLGMGRAEVRLETLLLPLPATAVAVPSRGALCGWGN